MSHWIKFTDKEPPKDGTIFLAKTIFCGSPDLLLLFWDTCIVRGKDCGHWSCQCGCLDAEDCIIGDIIEWMEIEE